MFIPPTNTSSSRLALTCECSDAEQIGGLRSSFTFELSSSPFSVYFSACLLWVWWWCLFLFLVFQDSFHLAENGLRIDSC